MQLKERKSAVDSLNSDLGLRRALFTLLISPKRLAHLLLHTLSVGQGLYVSQYGLEVSQSLLVRLREPAKLLEECDGDRCVLFQFDLAFGLETYLVVARTRAVLVLLRTSTEVLERE